MYYFFGGVFIKFWGRRGKEKDDLLIGAELQA